jgi:hypothetical protein
VLQGKKSNIFNVRIFRRVDVSDMK